MKQVQCGKCGKIFNKNESGNISALAHVLSRESNLCYNCALDHITGGNPPEYSDFNSALIMSGEMTDKEWALLQEDLRATEDGRSPRYSEPMPWDEEGYVDPYWCYRCDNDVTYCTCKCDFCDEYKEDCKCVCAICGVHNVHAHLCPSCESKWDETTQGWYPARKSDIGICSSCGIWFNNELKVDRRHHNWRGQLVEKVITQKKCPRCR